MKTVHRIGLLLWKNLTLRKRHYVITTFEILLPTVFAILVVFGNNMIGRNNNEGSDPDDSPTSDFDQPAQFYEEFSQTYLMKHFSYYRHLTASEAYYPVVLYTPKNTATEAIIRLMNETYQELIEDWETYDEYYNPCYDQFSNFTCTAGVWREVEDEREMEAFASAYFIEQDNYPDQEYPDGRLTAGIVFSSDMSAGISSGELAYKIRFPHWFNTETLRDEWGGSGPGYVPYEYLEFTGLQIMLDQAIIKFQSSSVPDTNISISAQAFPYPAFNYDSFSIDSFYLLLIPQMIILGFIFVVPSILRIIVNEKETGVHELLSLMGMPNWMHWLGYMINSMMALTISVTIVVGALFIPFYGKGGSVFSNSDPSLWWAVLFLYAISLTSFCFFVSTFFQRPALGITAGIVLYVTTYYAVVFPFAEDLDRLSLGAKMAICLIPNNALHYAVTVMATLELKGVGAQWWRIGEGINSEDSFGLYLVMIMFLANTFVYILLSLYLERVIPSPYGLRKPWYFLFLPSEWGIGKKKRPTEGVDWTISGEGDTDTEAFEKGPQNLKVGIDIRNLSKDWNGSPAVDGMNLKMYEGQITALLGQNGAGKTTTMSLLTGMFAPTSGTAYVNGYNIITEMEKVRADLGLCPQHNMLFNQLTVKENLIFFGRLSGRNYKEANAEATKLMEKLRLEEKRNSLSASLSGGQKRKLSLGCALIGGTKVVILDEPTSGLDVENRRMLWDLLLEFRVGRTIVLTTHFMEEADVLGDRIAIMDQGKLICSGTPMFLKNYYGTGYIIKLSLDSSQNQPTILELVQSHIPGATISKLQTGNPRELGIAIPTTSTSKFPELFSNLSSQKAGLGIQSFGLAQTTMDDVFVRVGEISANSSGEDFSSGANYNSFAESETESTKKISGAQLIFQQTLILVKKRIVYAYRRPVLLTSQFVIPILLCIASILITNSTFNFGVVDPPLTMTLSLYEDPITSYSSSSESLVAEYESVVGASAQRVDEEDMEAYYLGVAQDDLVTFRGRHIVGAAINESTIKTMYSTVATHAFPLSVSLGMSSILRKATGRDLTFEVTNHPFVDEARSIRQILYTHSSIPYIIFMILIPTGLSLVVASFVILPIEERRCSAKQLQLMTGLDSIIYWFSFFFWDFLFLFILAGLMVVWFPILESYNVFTSNGGGGVAFLILVAYAFQAIPFSYLASLLAKSVPGGYSLVTIVNILSGGGLCMAVVMLISFSEGDVRFVAWFARLLPGYGISSALSTFAQISMLNVKCNLLTPEQKQLVCKPGDSWGSGLEEMKECCDECGQEGYPDCFKITNYLTWSTNANIFYATEIDYYNGIMEDLVGMFLMGCAYMTLLILIEKGFIRKLRNFISRATEELVFKGKTTDDDVLSENARVEQLVSNDGKTRADALVVNDFCKSFGEFSAVSNVSFGVQQGECFGLLGVNGAGKTTTFRILTGDEVASKGNAFTGGKNLRDDRNSFLKNMGYCPQFDGIVGVLTGNEMLELFAGLRGVPRHAISKEVTKWMSKMGLSKSGKNECRNYSGGMKRRLSSAMGMIGEPQIVLLDEPTTGVDPVARRAFWKTITSLKNAGQAIVLTSHSMEECEQLCTRLAIMVNGELQCLGGVQHLKGKFAKGYSLTIKLKYMVEEIRVSRLDDLKHQVSDAFTPSTLKDQHQNILDYHLASTNLEWAFLFGTMERLRSAFVDILEDYSINQTTLEEVFLSFARQQYPERKAEVSRSCCRCCC